jgi:CBS domain-containing protein
MSKPVVTISPDLTLRQVLDEYFLYHEHGAYLVAEADRLLGVVTLDDVKRIDRDRWGTEAVRAAMQPLHDDLVVAPNAPADQLATKLEESKVALVAVNREIMGVITLPELGRWLQRRSSFGAPTR